MEHIVELEHISYAYEALQSPDEKWALRDVSLSIRKGERVAILGANGSGKSTLARLIAGLEAPDSGTVKLFGRVCKSDEGINPDVYAAARKKAVMVFQDPADQILGLSVAEDIAFGPENLRFSKERIQEVVQREVERFGFCGQEDVNPNELSGGQQQKLVLASALAMEPQLLVLDEAAAHLDAGARHHLFNELFCYTQERACALVYITHDLSDALLADRILVMQEGSLVAEGTPQTIFASPQQMASWNIAMPPQLVLQQELHKQGISIPFTLDEEQLCHSLEKSLTLQGAQGESRQERTTLHTSEALSLRHLFFSYNQVPVLEDVSLSIPKSDLCALIGKTGSGKTTLLRILAGLLANFNGEAVCDGIAPVEYTRFLRRPRRNRNLSRHVGYVMQAPERQLFAQTVLEDVSYGPKNLGLSPERAQMQALNTLEVLGIAHLAETSPFELSVGQARLVAIAGIAAMRAPLLLMDEPFAGLDERASSALRRLFASLREHQHTIIFTTHDMNEAARASRVALLAKKTIQLSAAPSEFFSHVSHLQDAGIALPWALWFSKKLHLSDTFFPASISDLAAEIAKRAKRSKR